ncbi:MAG: beta-ketoacyl synthase N-terminal-like domain-containing protein, partial [Methylococcales bacterium]
MSKRRIVVTGLGAVTPVGLNVDDTWRNILAGKSGIGPLTGFDTSGFSTCFGGEIRGLDISLYINPKDSKRMDGFIHYGMAAGIQAIRDSGIEIDERNADRIGVA